MSIISEAFNKLLELEKGQKLLITVNDQKQLHSYRTMFYKERELYKKRTGIELPLTCHKKVIDGEMVLEVSLTPVRFNVIGDKKNGRTGRA